MSIQNKIRNAKIKFFRRDNGGLQFFGILSYKFIWNVSDLPMIEEGHIQFDINDLSTTEDGRIHINENYLKKSDYTYDNLIFLICHEILHILKKHGLRKKNRDHLIWCFACDHTVDRDLKELKLIPYQSRFNTIQQLHDTHPICSTEEAYDWLIKNQNQFKFNGSPESGSGSESGFGEVTDTSNNDKFKVSPVPGDISNANDKTKELTINQVNQMIAEGRSIQESLEQKGNMPGNMSQFLNKLLKIELPWDSILEKAIKTNYIRKISERSWQKLNNYYIPHGLTMPGNSMDEDKENIGTMVIMVDSSGSISTKDLQKFSYVIDKFIHYFNKVVLIVHDVDIHQINTFDNSDRLAFQTFVNTIGFKGRGGTSHKPAFTYVQEHIWEDISERDVFSMCISLTDGWSDIEQIYKKFDWINNNIPLLIITPKPWEFKNNTIDTIQTIQMK